ncbi:MAG: DUF885 domain-containing protein [Candidatus Dormibacteria bacterium]
MSAVYDLADRYVRDYAVLDPVTAALWGVPGSETELTDYSPDGVAARASLAEQTLADLAALPEPAGRDRLAASVMRERLEAAGIAHDAGERLRDLRVLGSPFQTLRQAFDLMPTNTAAQWEAVASRLEKVPAALAGYRETLHTGLRRGLAASRRQAIACAEQGRVWSDSDPGRGFFAGLVERHHRAADGDGLSARLTAAARAAATAYAEAATWLETVYAPSAAAEDAVGIDRYRIGVRVFLGTQLDLEETYLWGWEELHDIETEMARLAEEIAPGRGLRGCVDLLESDPARSIEGVDAFRQWLQDVMDRAVQRLDGPHFDIAAPLHRVEAMIAPPGGPAAMYYTAPSDDFSRPGRTWYPTLGKTRFPLWSEMSTAFHEGVPGHHLQLAQVKYLQDELSRFQRSLGFVSGHGEGWALYAERLMWELDLFEGPEYVLGMYAAAAFRAMRVIVDIGLHLQLTIPRGQTFHPGERWTWELALPFAIEHGWHGEQFLRSEVTRYLGMPAQAISYKVGEREWLSIRDECRRRDGERFDLKAWHTRALNLGPVGLRQLRREMLTVSDPEDVAAETGPDIQRTFDAS